MSKIRVLVVDDSALMRKLLTDLLNSDSDIEVVGAAMDAYMARDKIKKLNPDVITLDVEMPKMDGLVFLGNLMRLHPMPVVMVSSLTEKGAEVTMRALELGAIDFVNKPKVDLAHGLEECAAEIADKIKAAAAVSREVLSYRANSAQAKPNGAANAEAKGANGSGASGSKHFRTTDQVIAIGASTGGTEAIKEVLIRTRPDSPGIVIAQHIPPVFSKSFADRMNTVSPLVVCEARDGQQIRPGHAFIAPGDKHLKVIKDGAFYRCKLDDGPTVNRHKPAVDPLFDSVAEMVGQNAIGVVLTGMGRDGALGLKRMRDAGAATIAQDEKTSVIYGMPRAAVEEGGAERVLPLNSIAAKIAEIARQRQV